MRFVDEVKIHVRAGKGGRGAATFHRAKFIPLGGPDGGDGGDGGHVILEARTDQSTLIDLRYQQRYHAKDGEPGSGAQCTGAAGPDLIVPVPVGTAVYRLEDSSLLGDLTEPGQRLVVARGGIGGRGNMRFTTSTNRAPTRYDEGEPGEELSLWLELKLIADVGLVGYPNAGKSTLISKMSAAKPKIADYPFTTLVPNLGVVRVDVDRSFVVADIPGLIEGASDGAGLGLKFLRHVERTRVFLHLLSLDGMDEESPEVRFEKLNTELRAYDEELAGRPQWVILTKIDAMEDRDADLPRLMAQFEAQGYPTRAISAVTGEGVRELIFAVADLLQQLPVGEGGPEHALRSASE